MRKLIVSVALCIVVMIVMTSSGIERNKINVIPVPVSVKAGSGYFVLDPSAEITYSGGEAARENAVVLAQLLGTPTGYGLNVKEGTNGKIRVDIDSKEKWQADEYRLTVTGENIILSAGTSAGLFYGIQTLRQLLPPEIESSVKVTGGVKWQVPCVSIKDYPRFGWRGMMLDCSRHFFPADSVKKFIDLLAMNKMNVFHWHLVDDQGWRIEIKKYPKLTEVGAWRVNREGQPWRGREPQKPGEVADYGGFYTQDQIRDVVAYAAKKHITVVPEIEMPAHVSSALAAYPQYSCTGGPFTVPTGSIWPITDIYCAGKDSTFLFIEDILTEVMELFPSQYIHIGGDEANKKQWKVCPLCQARIKEEGLKDEEALQGYFTKRIENFLIARGRKMIGWDEIMLGGISDNAAVMSWRGFDSGMKAARTGHKVVMCPTSYCYFDYYQGDQADEPAGIGGYVPLKKVYSFDPVPHGLSAKDARNIMGAQANLWTEFVPAFSHAEYMVLPRMNALAEVLWSPKKARNWDSFYDRISIMKKRFDVMGVKYGKGSSKIDIATTVSKNKKYVTVSLSGEQPTGVIRFTKDGTAPTVTSEKFTGSFRVKPGTVIKTAYFRADTLSGTIYEKEAKAGR